LSYELLNVFYFCTLCPKSVDLTWFWCCFREGCPQWRLEVHILRVNSGLVVKSHFVSCLYLGAIEIFICWIKLCVFVVMGFGNLGGHFGYSLVFTMWVELFWFEIWYTYGLFLVIFSSFLCYVWFLDWVSSTHSWVSV
jgi:hypothetical protein